MLSIFILENIFHIYRFYNIIRAQKMWCSFMNKGPERLRWLDFHWWLSFFWTKLPRSCDYPEGECCHSQDCGSWYASENPFELCLKEREQEQKNGLPLLPPPENEAEKKRPHGSELKTWSYCNFSFSSAAIRMSPSTAHSNWLLSAIFPQLTCLTTTSLQPSHPASSSSPLLAMPLPSNHAVSMRRYSA